MAKGDKWDEYYFFGGEDYELVFSLPKKWAKNLSKLDKNINEIGFFTDGEPSIEFKDIKKTNYLITHLSNTFNYSQFLATISAKSTTL